MGMCGNRVEYGLNYVEYGLNYINFKLRVSIRRSVDIDIGAKLSRKKLFGEFESYDINPKLIIQVPYKDEHSQQTHDVYTTSPQRRCNVMTLHRR